MSSTEINYSQDEFPRNAFSRPYICGFCKRQFYFEYELMAHIYTHNSDTQPLTCQVCEESFDQRDELIDHLTIHTGEKPRDCAKCGKMFMQKSYFTPLSPMYSAWHKLYTCERCGDDFRRRLDLKKHLRVHCGEVP